MLSVGTELSYWPIRAPVSKQRALFGKAWAGHGGDWLPKNHRRDFWIYKQTAENGTLQGQPCCTAGR